MAVNVQIDCIRKSGAQPPNSRVTHVGGPNPNGSGRWLLTEQDAIAGMDRGDWSFHINSAGRTVRVTANTGPAGRYLTTSPDNHQHDSLIDLPECG